ncbi:MAG: enterotoxin [Gluconobacter potus]|uniref:Enterotoxin n=1 Tax=Gluconobacter potus TaxID=2724927 RepID=A0ABR9YIU0_9PROT|nr:MULTISPECIES: enterotoxin [Gluconobacter]MBF0863357.1 enterotoxin [Gluconobacter sp. R71656]MBF0867511.1 enterotoxin [Gluconobacter sp. R75628]MBF0873691.1 enterotoxin [Gluconobacter sp. R75629]MBF0881675.1 enterotoxin [Gluconobacter potus]
MATFFRNALVATLLTTSILAPARAARQEAAILSPGPTSSDTTNSINSLGNDVVRLSWHQNNKTLDQASFIDVVHGRTVPLFSLFTITLANGEKISNENLHQMDRPHEEALLPVSGAARAADHRDGKTVVTHFSDLKGRFTAAWRVEQRNGSPYLRQILTVIPVKSALHLKAISLFDAHTDVGEVIGDVQGSPVAIEDSYFGIENPLADSLVFNGRSHLSLSQVLPVPAGHELTVSAVGGIVRHGQMRRDFQIYVERERTHPYRPFLNYNSWYDIGYFTPYTQKDAENRISRIGEELVRKRGVQLDSFLFDDGWDDRSGQWNFSGDFPEGFRPLCALASSYGAAPGVWLSPWGGYGNPKEIRVARGRKLGLETQDGGFDLSGQRYYAGFHKAVMTLLTQECINQFKFDGTGNASQVAKNSVFNSDFDAAIHLIADIYKTKPDTFINLTTGTYPSPFWLRTADSIWRGGEDDMLRGVGTKRQRWITYRDSDTYHNIVVKAPLFPLNSLMLHGVIYAQKNQRLNDDPGHDFADEVHSFFATGTDEQELYVTPDLLKAEDWDVIADTAKWARANAETLKDSHWVGGDPGRLEPYGWAAWTPQKAFLTLRNPDQKPRAILIEPRNVLELPADAPTRYAVHALWTKSVVPKSLDADHPLMIQLAPFEVMTLELTP